MCNLRGLLMLKLNRGDQAKACFMEALALDVKCYDAFEQLVGGEMMTLEEGALPPLFDCLRSAAPTALQSGSLYSPSRTANRRQKTPSLCNSSTRRDSESISMRKNTRLRGDDL
jgi:hypothetical protein